MITMYSKHVYQSWITLSFFGESRNQRSEKSIFINHVMLKVKFLVIMIIECEKVSCFFLLIITGLTTYRKQIKVCKVALNQHSLKYCSGLVALNNSNDLLNTIILIISKVQQPFNNWLCYCKTKFKTVNTHKKIKSSAKSTQIKIRQSI